MTDQQIERILADPRLAREILARIGKPPDAGLESTLSPSAHLRSRMREDPGLEKIIRRIGRPVLTIKNNSFAPSDVERWRSRLETARPRLEKAIRSVGRVEVHNVPDHPWGGTAWVIGEDLVVTNRHVADIFAHRDGTRLVFCPGTGGRPAGASIDFLREHESDATFLIDVESIVYLAPDDGHSPDVALLRLARHEATPPRIVLSADPVRGNMEVVAIGYPAYDPYEDDRAQQAIFAYYDVKRLAPGEVIGDESRIAFRHDCSTLGGNSGSVVLDLLTGRAAGLHFRGRSREANFAVRASVLDEILKEASRPAAVVSTPAGRDEAPRPRVHSPEELAGRSGYDPRFLGEEHVVPLPRPGGALADDLARGEGLENGVLHYTHFSVAMSRSRCMALFTAVNIDGNDLRRIVRKDDDKWYLDGRLPLDVQTGEDVYLKNKLDRGHLVRRLDPVWGADAAQADADTFHFTNACPQHEGLNQKTWLALEDYVLANVDSHDLRVSVFTGPVFRADDKTYRDVRIPAEFWKVVTMVRQPENQLLATAYLLTQRALLEDIEFAFGAFRTYQVPVTEVETLTGLDFGKLRDCDPLAASSNEAPGAAVRAIDGPADLVLQAPPMTPDALEKTLKSLKSGKKFREMLQLADRTGAYQSPRATIRKLAIQALIDTGQLERAIGELRDTRLYIRSKLEEPVPPAGRGIEEAIVRLQLRPELAEIEGLLGRVYKQRCIDTAGIAPAGVRAADALQSMHFYFHGYHVARVENLWHGVNYVAVADYARRNLEVPPPHDPPAEVAREILLAIDYLEESDASLTVWHHATRGEAALAIGDLNGARQAYTTFLADTQCDKFARDSAERQLVQVWQLPPEHELRRLFGVPCAVPQAAPPSPQERLQARFNDPRYSALADNPDAQGPALGVARLGSLMAGVGTGFYIDGAEIAPRFADRALVLTCAHVCPGAVQPNQVVAIFFGSEENPADAVTSGVAEIVWHSPVDELDATLLMFRGRSYVKPSPRAQNAVQIGDRAYVIGHPLGGAKLVSIENSIVRKVAQKRFRYGSATDPGSSGSPVFNDQWQVTGMHRAGIDEEKLNEGSRLDEIIKAMRAYFAERRA